MNQTAITCMLRVGQFPIARLFQQVEAHRDNGTNVLPHLPLDKMAAILADDKLKSIFSIENDRSPIPKGGGGGGGT